MQLWKRGKPGLSGVKPGRVVQLSDGGRLFLTKRYGRKAMKRIAKVKEPGFVGAEVSPRGLTTTVVVTDSGRIVEAWGKPYKLGEKQRRHTT